jgi:uncharacterized membrane protein YccC
MAENDIKRAKSLFPKALKTGWLAHSARTSVATVTSFAVARLCRMPESYWAAVTTIIVMQSTLGAAWATSKLRFIGTALGAALGALLATYFHPGIILYAAAIFALGLICAVLRLDRSAYRFAGIALTIVMLVARAEEAPWIVGLHRFIEVSLGIVFGLVFTAIWPQEELLSGKKP